MVASVSGDLSHEARTNSHYGSTNYISDRFFDETQSTQGKADASDVNAE